MPTVNKTDSKAFFVDEKFQLVADADAAEGCTQFTSVEELMAIDKGNLQKIHASVFGGAKPADAKKSSKKLATEIFAELDRNDEPGNTGSSAEGSNKEAKPKKKGKMDLIKETVKERGVITRKELAEVIGSDEANTHTMISILRNKDRTKEPVDIKYNKEDKTYSWPGFVPPAKGEAAADGEATTDGE